MKFLIASFFLLSSLIVNAQAVNQYEVIDKKVAAMPDSLSKSTSLIANYIQNNFKTNDEKVRAAFYWTASKISYDVQNMYAINFNETKEQKIDKTLKSKKGVCINYAEIFNDITNKLGVKSVVIEGYTRQNGQASYTAHAWCGVKMNEDWFVFDPTWASGYVTPKGQFVKKFNPIYYKADPVKIIISHMPFDYLWQFLGYPISNEMFLAGQTKTNKSQPAFDYYTEIEKYESLPYIDKLISSAQRIELAGVKNALVFDRLAHKKAEIQVLNHNKTSEEFNAISAQFNEAINQYNDFINYRNRKFTPTYTDDIIKEMIETPRNTFLKCKEAISNIKNIDDSNLPLVKNLSKSIDNSIVLCDEQLAFVKDYISKSKSQRKALFGQRTLLGF